jgi:hypothetical protein
MIQCRHRAAAPATMSPGMPMSCTSQKSAYPTLLMGLTHGPMPPARMMRTLFTGQCRDLGWPVTCAGSQVLLTAYYKASAEGSRGGCLDTYLNPFTLILLNPALLRHGLNPKPIATSNRAD